MRLLKIDIKSSRPKYIEQKLSKTLPLSLQASKATQRLGGNGERWRMGLKTVSDNTDFIGVY